MLSKLRRSRFCLRRLGLPAWAHTYIGWSVSSEADIGLGAVSDFLLAQKYSRYLKRTRISMYFCFSWHGHLSILSFIALALL